MAKSNTIDCTGQDDRHKGVEYLSRLNTSLRIHGRPYTITGTREQDGVTIIQIAIQSGSVFGAKPGTEEKSKSNQDSSIGHVPESVHRKRTTKD